MQSRVDAIPHAHPPSAPNAQTLPALAAVAIPEAAGRQAAASQPYRHNPFAETPESVTNEGNIFSRSAERGAPQRTCPCEWTNLKRG